jgi:UDP-glucose 4-epimerase
VQHTILVTGGAGYIGSHTALLLAQQGYNVIIIDDLSQHQSFQPNWATFIQADFADKQVLSELFTTTNIDVVVHFAAFIEVGQSVKEPLKFFNNNVTKTAFLLETMLKHNITKFIFSSSCAIYGKPQQLPLTEDHPKAPISPYGRNKLIIEQLLADLNKAYALNYVVLRYFNAAGAWPEYGLGEQHSPESHIIPLLIRAAQTQKPFSIFGTNYPTKDGTCIRDYLHVLDLAHAHILALHHLEAGRPSDAFNLGTGHGYSVKQIIEAVERISQVPIKTIIEDERSGDPPQLIADPTRAHNILEWGPKFSDLDFIIRSAYAFHTQTTCFHKHASNSKGTLV